jgi:hypothetical protein
MTDPYVNKSDGTSRNFPNKLPDSNTWVQISNLKDVVADFLYRYGWPNPA